MLRIAELSKDVARRYREQRKTKLQRTFVTASSAAESRFTGNTNSYILSQKEIIYLFVGKRASDTKQ